MIPAGLCNLSGTHTCWLPSTAFPSEWRSADGRMVYSRKTKDPFQRMAMRDGLREAEEILSHDRRLQLASLRMREEGIQNLILGECRHKCLFVGINGLCAICQIIADRTVWSYISRYGLIILPVTLIQGAASGISADQTIRNRDLRSAM
mgnify:CR=1 FL=1